MSYQHTKKKNHIYKNISFSLYEVKKILFLIQDLELSRKSRTRCWRKWGKYIKSWSVFFIKVFHNSQYLWLGTALTMLSFLNGFIVLFFQQHTYDYIIFFRKKIISRIQQIHQAIMMKLRLLNSKVPKKVLNRDALDKALRRWL